MKPHLARIHSLVLSPPWQTNCFLVHFPESADPHACWCVDVGGQPQPMLQAMQRLGLVPQAIVLTHTHVDHIAGVRDLLKSTGPLPIWVHRDEQAWLLDPELNLSEAAGLPSTTPAAERLLEHDQTIELAGQPWRVIHVPGHSPGSVGLYHAPSELLIGGDALFSGSIGRTDLPGGNHDQLLESIRTRFYTLPDSTKVLPGHGPATTIGQEKRSNPFVRA